MYICMVGVHVNSPPPQNTPSAIGTIGGTETECWVTSGRASISVAAGAFSTAKLGGLTAAQACLVPALPTGINREREDLVFVTRVKFENRSNPDCYYLARYCIFQPSVMHLATGLWTP